jgi:hypothetical protein
VPSGYKQSSCNTDRLCYFSHGSKQFPDGSTLLRKMKNDPSNKDGVRDEERSMPKPSQPFET